MFLTANAKKYRLKETHINDIRKQEVSGIHLLKFTVQQFQSIGLGLGPADSIVTLAGTLKIAKGLVEPGKYYNSISYENMVSWARRMMTERDSRSLA